jgi:hypothetical protein
MEGSPNPSTPMTTIPVNTIHFCDCGKSSSSSPSKPRAFFLPTRPITINSAADFFGRTFRARPAWAPHAHGAQNTFHHATKSLNEELLRRPDWALRWRVAAVVFADGSLSIRGRRGPVHQMARLVHSGPCIGWEHWFLAEGKSGRRVSIDSLREKLRKQK